MRGKAGGPRPGESPDQLLRRRVREFWQDDEPFPPDGSGEPVSHLRKVCLIPTDSASVECFDLLLAEAPRGSRLAVKTDEWAWPMVEHIRRRTNPDVTLHWVQLWSSLSKGRTLMTAAPCRPGPARGGQRRSRPISGR